MSLVGYLKDRFWDLCCSLRTQLLSVKSSGDTLSTSTHTLTISSYTSNLRWLKSTDYCLYADVRACADDSQLKVNYDKTVALVLSSRTITVIKIGDCDITLNPIGRNIGVIFDTEMSMVSYVKHVCCTSCYHLRNIASIRSCLTQKIAVRLVYYLVISRIDYANCLLYDLPQCLISKLQRVQNAAARLVVRCHRRELHQFSWNYIGSRWNNECNTQYCYWCFVHNIDWRHLTSSTCLNKELRECYAQPQTMTSMAAISQPIRW